MRPNKNKVSFDKKKDLGWQVWVDTGGTFTDCLALDPAGKLHRMKVLSSSALRGTIEETKGPREIRVEVKWSVPADFIKGFEFVLLDINHPKVRVEKYHPSLSVIKLNKSPAGAIPAGTAFEVRCSEEAPVLAVRLVTGTPMGHPLPEIAMRLATTRGTNALLQRRGAPIAFFITKGFGDILRIGNQQRPELFALDIRKPEPLYQAVAEVPERITADGKTLKPLQLNKLEKEVSRLVESGIRVAAVALMNSYINPEHERQLARFLLERGFDHVSCSSDLAPFIRLLPRAETAVVDAYLVPVIDDYLDRVQTPVNDGRLYVMTSAGGLVQSKSVRAKDSLLSGPAGGVVGAVLAGRSAGFEKLIAFDMGGTSTDVARFDGDYDYVFEHEVGDAHLVAPALAIESVAAGGGSICSSDGTKLQVGPQSAGAQPGPACYGAGGPLTLTDVNLLLGRLDGSRFEIPIDIDCAKHQFEKTLGLIQQHKDEKAGKEELLKGFLDIANERMADAIRRISIRKGYDPKDYALVAFGGAGGQHACAVAEQLSIDTIVIPQDASLLSALGLGHAVIERFSERQILQRLDVVQTNIAKWIRELEVEAVSTLEKEGICNDDIEIRRRIVNLRFVGQDSVLQIEYDKKLTLQKAFECKYKTIFGHWLEGRPIEVESVRVAASSKTTESLKGKKKVLAFCEKASRHIQSYFDGKWQSVAAFERSELLQGAQLTGPALIFERHSVSIVEPGWTAHIDASNAIVLRKTEVNAKKTTPTQSKVVQLELFTNRFRSIAAEMGEMLGRMAISTNVKERLDFSCAILDKGGELVVNAPHIPVHLGSMGLCVRKLKEVLTMEPGDVIVTNHPEFGGSHLPDISVVTPVHLPDGSLLGFVASRAHHAEIGGAVPASMPPAATTLIEEGAVIPPTYLFKGGKTHWDKLRSLLLEAPFPSRAVEENLADIRAAVAANLSGSRALLKLSAEYGEQTIRYYMKALKERAESRIRLALRKIPDGTYEASERLDDGSALCVCIAIKGDRAEIDFSGSADVHPNNLNATPAIVHSVVIYVLRLLVNEPLPLNEGLMRAVTLHIPRGILNPVFGEDPSKAPAVVGGNVETSQRLVDTLLKALNLAACSQGTMNNVTFGNDRCSYYETVCGGCGAGPNFDGASAVHSHMTNTRITDAEVLEHRYSVRIERFAIRKGSGGEGKHRGGDGVVREITFLEEMSLSLLGQHRREGPYGLEGGESGKPAEQCVIRASGEIVKLVSVQGCEVKPNDRLLLKTPGGGGYGPKKS